MTLARIQVFAAVGTLVPLRSQRTIQLELNLWTPNADQCHSFSLTKTRLDMVVPERTQMDCAGWDAKTNSNAESRGYRA